MNKTDEIRGFPNCRNCGEIIDERYAYCPSCGQSTEEKIISFKDLFLDFLGDLFTFDSKFFRSLVPFLFKPGSMTRDFLEGRRESYIPPLRILIFLSLIYGIVLSQLAGGVDWSEAAVFDLGDQIKKSATDSIPWPNADGETELIAFGDLPEAVKDSLIDRLEANISSTASTFLSGVRDGWVAADSAARNDSAAAAGLVAAAADTAIAAESEEADSEDDDSFALSFETDSVSGVTNWTVGSKRFSAKLQEMAKNLEYSPEEIADSLVERKSWVRVKGTEQIVKVIRSGGEDYIGFIIGNLPILLLVAIPLFALILKLFYWRRKQYYVAHFIFSTHAHAFLVFLLILSALCLMFMDFYPRLLIGLAIPYYFISLKRVYKQSWGKTIFKGLLLHAIYVIIFMPTFLIVAGFVSFLYF